MESEYVGLNYSEKVYVEKTFLHTQLELLNGIKRIREYKNLRKEELVLKIALKKTVKGILEDLRTLEKILPKVEYIEEEEKEEAGIEKGDISLSEEIARIRTKLGELGS